VQLGKGSGLWSMQWGRPGQGPGQERTWGSPKAEEVRVDRGCQLVRLLGTHSNNMWQQVWHCRPPWPGNAIHGE